MEVGFSLYTKLKLKLGASDEPLELEIASHSNYFGGFSNSYVSIAIFCILLFRLLMMIRNSMDTVRIWSISCCQFSRTPTQTLGQEYNATIVQSSSSASDMLNTSIRTPQNETSISMI